MSKVVFPSFAGENYQPYEIRQLVSALELRFQSIETNSASLFSTDSDDLDDRYSLVGHTHSESEITDLQPYLININNESIFDLSDVTGTPALNDTLVWDGSSFVASAAGAASIQLNDLTDVSVPAPNDSEVLTYNSTTMVWEAQSSAGLTSFAALSDTDLSGQAQYDMVFNADGTEWQDTAGALIWNPLSNYLQLANAHSINWLDALGATTKLIEFDALDVLSVGSTANRTDLKGTAIRIADSLGTSFADITHDSSDFKFAFTSTAIVEFGAISSFYNFLSNVDVTADIFITGGNQFQMFGSNASNYVIFGPHDNTDFPTAFTNTTDWLITGLAGGEMNIDGSLTVQENLTVEGTLTSINTTDLTITDNIIVLNNDAVDPPSDNAGIEIERGGVVNNVVLRWNETTDRWQFTNDGTTYIDIPLETNATHTGEVTGATVLTVDVTSITNQTDVVAEAADDVTIHDDSDGLIKKVNLSSITDAGYF